MYSSAPPAYDTSPITFVVIVLVVVVISFLVMVVGYRGIHTLNTLLQ